MENLPPSEETKRDNGNDEKPPARMPIDLGSHWLHVLLVFFAVGLLDGFNRAYLMVSREEFQMMGDFFLARFREDLNVNALILAREYWRFLVALKYFLRDAIFMIPAVLIRFILVREPIMNPHGCAFAVIFTLGLLSSVLFGRGFYGIASGVGKWLVIFGWYQILMTRRKYQSWS